jgi:tight adherence protein C
MIEAGLIGVVSGVGLGVFGLLAMHSSPVALAAYALLGLAAGVWVRRRMLQRSARTRVALMLEELPALCELLAICLSAGEGFREAVARVSARGQGPLVSELRAVLRATELGTPMVSALSAMSARLDVLPLSRTIDHIVSSIERGTPLAGVLRTQAAEARGEAGRRLQERASAREVVMLVPLVFLILPITIAFAVFPGLLVIQAGF